MRTTKREMDRCLSGATCDWNWSSMSTSPANPEKHVLLSITSAHFSGSVKDIWNSCSNLLENYFRTSLL